MFPADYLAKDIIPFVLKDLEKFASNNANWCNRKKKQLTITLGKKTNIYLFCSTKINRKKPKTIHLTESLLALFNVVSIFLYFLLCS